MTLGFTPAIRYAKLTPEGVRYANDADRREEAGRMAQRAMAAASKDAIHVERDELPDLVQILGGPNVRVPQTVILHDKPGRAHVVFTPPGQPGMTAAALQATLERKLEETREDAERIAARTSLSRRLLVADRAIQLSRGLRR